MKIPRICSPGDGYAALAVELLSHPITVARGQKTGDREQATAFLETEFAGILLSGLGIEQSWLLERLRHEPGA